MIKVSENEYLIGNSEPESNLPEDRICVEFTTWDDIAKGVRRFRVSAPKIKELVYDDNGQYSDKIQF